MQPRLSDFDDLRVPIVLQPRQPALMRRLMLRMVESWLSPDPLRKLDAQAAGTELFSEIVRDHAAGGQANASPRELDWVDAYLSFHLAEPLSVREMASRAHLSPSRFRDVFRRQFGVPPHQYLVRLRMAHAKDMLLTTDYSLAQITEYCGFSDVSHFSNAFKKESGLTPGAYRRQEAKV